MVAMLEGNISTLTELSFYNSYQLIVASITRLSGCSYLV